MTIDANSGVISNKGRCVGQQGDAKFVFMDDNNNLNEEEEEECFRCLVIHQRADNVLQYKESEFSENFILCTVYL